MNKKQSKLIMGSAIGLAAILVAIDHTRHSLPPAEPPGVSDSMSEEEAPCGMGTETPCGLEAESPCGMDETPCGMTGAPCGMGTETPCGLD